MRKESELDNWDKKALNKLLSNHRKHPFEDPRAQTLSERFHKLSFLVEPNEKDEFAKMFLDYAGVELSDPDWWNKVGRNLNGVGKSPTYEDVKTFWEKVHEKFPEWIFGEEARWLKDEDKSGAGVFHLFYALNNDLTPPEAISPLASKILSAISYWK